MRLIDGDKLLTAFEKCTGQTGIGMEPVMAVRDAKAMVMTAPTIKAVPVKQLFQWLAANGCDPSCRVCENYQKDGLCVHTDIPCGSQEHWRLILTKWMKKKAGKT